MAAKRSTLQEKAAISLQMKGGATLETSVFKWRPDEHKLSELLLTSPAKNGFELESAIIACVCFKVSHNARLIEEGNRL